MDISLRNLQPSQFYISQVKTDNIKKWFNPSDLSNFKPISIKIIDDKPIIIDGHTRCVVAIMAGLNDLPLEYEQEEWDWDTYRLCIKECQLRNIYSPYDLTKRIISKEKYFVKWIKWCDELH